MALRRPSFDTLLRWSALGAIAALSLAAAVSAHAAEPTPTAMIVFDGSGSMWGRIEGDRLSRLQVARDALRKALPALPPATRVGLSAFGHRRKGDCSDVETIVAPDALDAETLMAPLDRLNPKGKGPLVLAIREAAKELVDAGSGAASIVLVHDGPDNCQQDACAAAAEIAKAQPSLAIHTVGIGLAPEDASKMSCVAAATGGRSFDARTATEVDEAMAAALKLAQLERGQGTKAPKPTSSAAEKAAPAAAKALPETAAAAPGLSVTAALTAEGAALDTPVRWRVFKGDGAGPPLFETDAPRLDREAAPGNYVVEARVGLAQARQKIAVTDKPATPVRIGLDAGVVTPAARAGKDGDIEEGATYSIRDVKPAAGARSGKALWIGRSGGSDIVLPAGTYVVRAEIGLVVKDETVSLPAGSRKALDIVLGSGRLEVSASLAEDGPVVDNVMFVVMEDDPDSPRGLREVARSAASRPLFVLPAGTYYVTARVAGAEARQRIAVGAGDTVKRTIALGLSRLGITTRLDTPGTARKPAILTRVVRLDGVGGEAARSAVDNPEFLLPAGRYQIAVQAGPQNVRAERAIEIKPREDTKLAIAFDAAHVVLKVRDGVPATIDQFWEVRDAKDQVVWRTTQSEVRMTLAPGRYSAAVEWRGRRLETAFDVASGEQKTVALGAE